MTACWLLMSLFVLILFSPRLVHTPEGGWLAQTFALSCGGTVYVLVHFMTNTSWRPRFVSHEFEPPDNAELMARFLTANCPAVAFGALSTQMFISQHISRSVFHRIIPFSWKGTNIWITSLVSACGMPSSLTGCKLKVVAWLLSWMECFPCSHGLPDQTNRIQKSDIDWWWMELNFYLRVKMALFFFLQGWLL